MSLPIPILGRAVPRRGNRLSAALCRWLVGRLGWRIVSGPPDVAKAVLIIVPHTSNWDFLVGITAMFALEIRVSFLAKHTLFRWPLGAVMRWLGGVSVDRDVAAGVVDVIVAEFAARDALILVVAPEGTRGQVARWKTGFHRIARGAEVPIVPVTFDYRLREIRFGAPLAPSDDLALDLARLERFFEGSTGKRAP